MYNGKNYNEQGGDALHIGGKLVFDEGATIEGFPGAANVEADTGAATKNAAVLNALLIALKNAGLMVGDAWNVSCKTATGTPMHDMPTAETLSNSQKVTSITVGEDNVITMTLNCEVEDLDDADHGGAWGKHKWIGFGVTTGLASVVGVKFTQTNDPDPTVATLTSADATEASDVGLSAGDFVLYIKAEKVIGDPMTFTLWYDGYATTEYKLVIEEAEGE